jgi:hypothetical protein
MNENPFTHVNPFRHPKNIQVGVGRILWGTACRPLNGYYCDGVCKGAAEAGWVLPGGRRTTNRSEAEAAARWIAMGGHF